MVERVLVPIDGSEQAERACTFVVEEFPGTTMVLLHVIDPAEAGFSAQSSLPSFSEEWYEQEQEKAERQFDEIEAAVETGDVTVERAVEVGTPTNAIVDYADENDVDLIVMGSHGRDGVTRILLGSVAETVVRRAPVPVTVTR
jgi:nucleotide-binding universal stress UspA family protein